MPLLFGATRWDSAAFGTFSPITFTPRSLSPVPPVVEMQNKGSRARSSGALRGGRGAQAVLWWAQGGWRSWGGLVPPEGAEPLESSEEQFERIMKQISACSQRALLKHQAGMGENREVFGIQQLEMEIAAVVWGAEAAAAAREGAAGCAGVQAAARGSCGTRGGPGGGPGREAQPAGGRGEEAARQRPATQRG